jgi:hypothetical protein
MPPARKTPRRKDEFSRRKDEAEELFDGYSKTPRPLGGYAILVGLFTVAFGSALAASAKDEDELPELKWSDLVLLGIATHKLSRIVTKDIVTSPFRAPFVEFKKDAGAGEVEEEARGEGLQEAGRRSDHVSLLHGAMDRVRTRFRFPTRPARDASYQRHLLHHRCF